MKLKPAWLTLLVAFSVSSAARAGVIQVPGQHATIQAALSAARAGDLIVVGAGTYQENLVWPKVDGLRLVSREGAALTTIDGAIQGRVVEFPTGLTRATLLQGFTLTRGRHATGAGVYTASSVTLRFNRIHGNEAQGTTARGGGVYVAAGAAPLIDRNVISSNKALGQRAYGAGVFVDSGSGARIQGNEIRENSADGSIQVFGVGVCIDGQAASPVIAVSNVIVLNDVLSNKDAFGGGVAVLGGPVDLFNNTVCDNDLTKGQLTKGGGLYFGSSARPGSNLVNNIVAANPGGGGIHVDGGKPFLNYNDVWGNQLTNYVGVAPGKNDLSVDPGFVGSRDYHLAAASPLIDAGLNAGPPRQVAIDMDGDPRFVDGRLTGQNAARADIGADEISQVRLRTPTPAYTGRESVFEVTGPAGASFVLALSPLTSNLEIHTFGLLLIHPFGLGVIGSGGSLPGRVRVPVPAVAAVMGVPVFIQGLVLHGQAGAFTNRLDLVLLDAPRAVHESFADTKQRDAGQTTAEWSAGPGRPGLVATFGYGGSGADGNLVVNGKVKLDSSTRQPGPDGVVEWNLGSLVVKAGGVLTLTGRYPIRLNVLGTCIVQGDIDLAGKNGLNAPAGKAISVGRLSGGAGGPGGGAGGDSNVNPSHPRGATPMELRGGPGWPRVQKECGEINRSENRTISPFEPNCGGGVGGNRGYPFNSTFRSGCSGNGGGHERDGVATDYLCLNVQANGGYYGERWVLVSGSNNEVQAPTGGTGGGAGGNAVVSTTNTTPANDIVAGSGGGAGGGVEIVAAEPLAVYGRILADGGNGGAGYTTIVGSTTVAGGWGAGGSGGSIWLSGTSVTVQSSAVFSAQGGTGNPRPTNPARTGDGGDGYIIIRDLGGNPTLSSGSQILPKQVLGRASFTPAANGQSTAVSLFYDSGQKDPKWTFNANDPNTGEVKSGADLVFLDPPGSGQKVYIAFQGAPDLGGKPDPDPKTWFPQSAFEPDITKLGGKGLRHIRFEIRFDIGKRQKGQPAPNRVAIQELSMRY